MRAVPNTLRRAGVYYFRRAPIELRPLLNRAELCCSLRISDLGRARSLSRGLYLRSENLFALARSSSMLTQADLARLVQDFYATVLTNENEIRLQSAGPIDEETRLARIAHFAWVADNCRRDLASNNLLSADFVTALMIQKAGLTDKIADPLDIRQVQQAILRAGCDLAGALKARRSW